MPTIVTLPHRTTRPAINHRKVEAFASAFSFLVRIWTSERRVHIIMLWDDYFFGKVGKEYDNTDGIPIRKQHALAI